MSGRPRKNPPTDFFKTLPDRAIAFAGNLTAIATSYAVSSDTFKRWRDGDPRIDQTIEHALASTVQPVDQAMMREAVNGDVAAAKVVYRRYRQSVHEDVARTDSVTPQVNIQIITSTPERQRQIATIRGEFEDELQAGALPDRKPPQGDLLPGSSFLTITSRVPEDDA